jgi:squalene-hopene/tetraprenyl-beta-curcumene cyclase
MSHRARFAIVPVAVLFACSVVAAQNAPAVQAQNMIDHGISFLKTAQKPDGSWQAENEPPGITALALRGIVQDPKSANADWVKKGYDKLLSYQLADGGIYKDLQASYNTSISLSALAAANNPNYKTNIDRAVTYLKQLQWTENTVSAENEKIAGTSDAWFGGWGYGGRSRGSGRPDLSNAQMAIEALRDAGLDPSDPAFAAAITFTSRLQNYSETNDQPWAGNDGGFVYGPADKRQGESMAGEYTGPDGKRLLRSYGSMTYAGLKSFIHAGLNKDDPRVKAAFEWISKNWTLDENPGMKASNPDSAKYGLYYFLHTLARAMNEYDQPVITDINGAKHDWRNELIEKLASLQKPDGSWIGESRWMESNPVLVTSYVLGALHEVNEDLKQHPLAP